MEKSLSQFIDIRGGIRYLESFPLAKLRNNSFSDKKEYELGKEILPFLIKGKGTGLLIIPFLVKGKGISFSIVLILLKGIGSAIENIPSW